MITLPNLDTDLTSACQLSCVNCNRMVNPYRFVPGGPPSTTVAQVEHDLLHFGKIAHTRRWAALGGEPLLHHKLVDILKVVRASGVADNIAVWSNGMLVPKQKPEFWRSFDTLVVSAYPGKHTDDTLDWIRKKCEDEGVELTLKDERVSPNWTRIIEASPTDDQTTQAKYDACWYKTYCYALNFGHLFRCCTSPHIPQLLQGRPYGVDGIPVEGLTEAAMATFLNRREFMESCRVCCGRNTEQAVPVKWVEVHDPAKWLAASAGLPGAD